MENQNNVDLEKEELKRQFAEYRKQQAETIKKTKFSSEEILSKYFTPRKDRETFRILPINGKKSKPFEEFVKAYFHSVTVIGKNGEIKHNKKVYCPAHNDPKIQKLDSNGQPLFDQEGKPVMVTKPCPLCEKSNKIMKSQNPVIRDLIMKGTKKEDLNPSQLEIFKKNNEIFAAANDIKAKLYYIVKGIDKGAEKDGIKFWRFVDNTKGGTYKSLEPVIFNFTEDEGTHYADPINGCNFIISMGDVPNNFGKGKPGYKPTYKAITNISYKKALLHEDPLVAKQWLEDTTTWRDVFKLPTLPVIDSYQYLEMLSKGYNPYWDETDDKNKHWVFPNHPDLEIQANTRKLDLTSQEEKEIEQASDLNQDVYTSQKTNITNVTPQTGGTFKDTAMDLGATALSETENIDNEENDDAANQNESYESDDQSDDYGDDLPF